MCVPSSTVFLTSFFLLMVFIPRPGLSKCCGEGLRQINEVDLCDGPCCPELEEIREHPRFLPHGIVYCQRPQYKIRPMLIKPTVWRPNQRPPQPW